ncbi:MAG: hypothetical protein SNJ56_02025 [Termitinemataceae bacterium]
MQHRVIAGSSIIYPVISRRSRGLSIGINLFPNKKVCSFDCPYCEVFPPTGGKDFSLSQMEMELQAMARELVHGCTGSLQLFQDHHAGVQNTRQIDESRLAVQDLAFSGNGEPTMHPLFREALELAAHLRNDLFPQAKLVLITNGNGLLDQKLAETLAAAARGEPPAFQGPQRNLEIWLKFDAGTEAWYRNINRSTIPFPRLWEAIAAFSQEAPYIIQTMVCTIDGQEAPDEEINAWEHRICELVTQTRHLGPQGVQLYSKARPAPEDPRTEAVAPDVLKARAERLLKALGSHRIPIDIFP